MSADGFLDRESTKEILAAPESRGWPFYGFLKVVIQRQQVAAATPSVANQSTDPIETFKRLNAEQQRSFLTALLKQLSGGKRYVFHNRPKPYWWPDSVDHSGVNVLKEPEREELYKHLVDLLSSESVPEVTFEKFQKAVDQLRQTPPPPHGRPPPPYTQQYGMPPPPLAVDPAASPWSTSASTFSQQYTMPPPPPVGNPAAAPWSTSAATYSQQYGMPPPPPACNPAAAPWSTSAATYSQQYGMPQPPPAGNPAAAPRSTSDATYSQQYGMPPPPPAGNPAAPPRSTSDATFSQQYTMPPPLPACNPAAAPWSTSAATYSQQYGMPPPPPAGNPAAAPRSTSDATFSQQYGMPPPPPAGNPAASPQSTSVATLPQQYTMPPPPPAGNPAAAPRSTSAATLPQQYTMPPPPPAGNPAAAPSKVASLPSKRAASNDTVKTKAPGRRQSQMYGFAHQTGPMLNYAALNPPSIDDPCMTCGRRSGTALMLVCDRCNKCYHTFCLSMLPYPPPGDWICSRCVEAKRNPVTSSPTDKPKYNQDSAQLAPVPEDAELEDDLPLAQLAPPFRSKSTPVSANGTRPPYVSPDDESPADEPDVEAEWMRVMQPNVWRDTYTSTGSKKYGPEDVIVHYKPNPRVEIVLTRDKLQNSMAPLACVADEVIDLFTGLLQANADEGLTGQDVLVVPVFIPPPKGDTAEKPCGHWVCAVIDVQGKSITADRSEITANLLRWIDDATTRFGNRINQAEWTQHTPPNVVQQGNDKDCGIFTMLFAYLVGRRIAVPGRGASIDVTTLRKYFLYMLVTKVVDLPPLRSKLH
ncbi:hypothetical protein PLESTB_000229200 [Pleodorina starrii]|uniref:PHD-type domain-containing protein n=1 Tax=Pleodorina starrii TaxID=330485 RepID=A0A9W6EYS3_9CHLO|nr:hypothetical protein PLESTB_000229200 [Pleodorina starrii]GLC69993.1 hypothetical protein PLESTF_000910500 [Pleodorina starrii]